MLTLIRKTLYYLLICVIALGYLLYQDSYGLDPNWNDPYWNDLYWEDPCLCGNSYPYWDDPGTCGSSDPYWEDPCLCGNSYPYWDDPGTCGSSDPYWEDPCPCGNSYPYWDDPHSRDGDLDLTGGGGLGRICQTSMGLGRDWDYLLLGNLDWNYPPIRLGRDYPPQGVHVRGTGGYTPKW